MLMRFLIAEDDAVSARVLKKIVERFGEVETAENGELAFDLFQQKLDAGSPFDVIFLDIMMPEVGGQEALEAIREYEDMKGLDPAQGSKVVMVTALTDGGNIYQALRNNCVDYVTKPVSVHAITRCLMRLGFEPK